MAAFKLIAAQLLLSLAAPVFSQDCIPTFYNSEPRDAEWFYGAGKGQDAQAARESALTHLFDKATGGDRAVPVEILAGWEQDDHGECRGLHYALARIEKERVRKNRAGLPKKEAPKREAAPELSKLLAALNKQERPPQVQSQAQSQSVIVNNEIKISTPGAPAAQPDGGLKYIVLAVLFMAFAITVVALLARPHPPAPVPPPPAPEPEPQVRRRDFPVKPADETGTVQVDKFRYRILGRIGRGESTDVFLAERAALLTERVVLKIQRARDGAELIRREYDALYALSRGDVQGSAYFTTRIPQLVGIGPLRPSAGEPLTLVLRHHGGFVETLQDLLAAYPEGLDARHAVWIWRRLLEVLGWVHRAGYAHGAVLPRHMLVNARDHGVLLVGWSCAGKRGAALPALAPEAEGFYPESARRGLSPETDLAMAARCVCFALSGKPDVIPAATPEPLAKLLRAASGGGEAGSDAEALDARVRGAAREAFGPPRYVPLATPLWGQLSRAGG